MTQVVPVGYGSAAFKYTVTGDDEVMVTTIGFKGNVSTAAGMRDAAENLTATWDLYMNGTTAQQISSSYTFGGSECLIATSDEGTFVHEVNFNDPGTYSGSFLPNNCSFLVRKITPLGGRRGRGRMFLPPAWIPENFVNATGIIDAGDVTTIQGYLDDFKAAVVGSADVEDLYLLHNDAPLPVPSPTVITSLALQPKIATTRSRLRS